MQRIRQSHTIVLRLEKVDECEYVTMTLRYALEHGNLVSNLGLLSIELCKHSGPVVLTMCSRPIINFLLIIFAA